MPPRKKQQKAEAAPQPEAGAQAAGPQESCDCSDAASKQFVQAQAARSQKPGPETQTAQPRPDHGGPGKLAVTVALAFIVLYLAYSFFLAPPASLGIVVDADTFKGTLASSDRVFIVMDVRGVTDPATRDNVIQCGVDFAASSAIGGKNRTIFSFSNGDEASPLPFLSGLSQTCISTEGERPIQGCLDELGNGVTILVTGGQEGAEYYSHGMVVRVGRNYTVGTCGIHRT